MSPSSKSDCRCKFDSSTKSRSTSLTKPTPARTSWSAVTVPRAPRPTRRIRDSDNRCWPVSPIGPKRIWREYRSSGGKRFHLPFHAVENCIDQRLGFDSHGLRHNSREFLSVFGQHKKGCQACLPQADVCKHDGDSKIADIERPDIDDPRQNQCGSLDRMDLGKTLSCQPAEEVVERPADILWIRAIVTAKNGFKRALPQRPREHDGMHAQQPGLRHLPDFFARLTHAASTFKFLERCVRFDPDKLGIHTTKAFQRRELQPGPQH